MEVLAKGKYIKTSPKKARPVADLIRGKNAKEAQIMLSAMPQTAAREMKIILESAMANAENNFNLEKNQLIISKVAVDKGPVAKRYMPRAQGRASQILRQTSHIEIVVSGDIKTKKKAADTNDKGQNKMQDAKPSTSVDSAVEDSKKIEMDRPQDKISVNVNKKGSAPKMFRRKTG